MSKEHFWPDWLRDYVEKNLDDKYTQEILESEAKSPSKLKMKKERPGNLITLKFRLVCESCNSGWMSQLEEKVKPFIVEVIEGKNPVLTKDNILDLAKWVTMKVMVAEQSDDGTQVTPENDRMEFYKNQKIPDYFRIYVGKHNIKDKSAYQSISITLALSKQGPLTKLNGMKRNTQSVSFLLGPMFIYLIACRESEYKVWQHFKLNQMRCIFPSTKNTLSWKSLKLITHSRIRMIANALDSLVQSKLVKYGGPRPESQEDED